MKEKKNEGPMGNARPIHERLEMHSEVDSNTGCRIWKGRVDKNGYPVLKINGERVCVRPVAFEVAYGDRFHSNMVGRPQVRMSCGVKTCINPAHMTVRTDEDRLFLEIRQEVYLNGRTRAEANPRFAFMTTPKFVDAEARRQLEIRLAREAPLTPEVHAILDQIRR
ncbi:hypothetical protein [Azospirillum argentinense]